MLYPLLTYISDAILTIHSLGVNVNILLWLVTYNKFLSAKLRKGKRMSKTRNVLSAVAIAVITATSFDNAWAEGINSPSKTKAAQIVLKEAQAAGVPVELALAVARVESHFTCNAKGSEHAMGVMQIKPSTARSMGFKGNSNDLLDCETGAHYAVLYLKAALEKADGDQCQAIGMYRSGLSNKKVSDKLCKMALYVTEQINNDMIVSAIDSAIVGKSIK
jgi:soluble lytic murein transglycosylase-like protein